MSDKIIKLEFDMDEIMCQVDAEEIVEHFKRNDCVDQLLDVIGKDACIEHFGAFGSDE